MYSGYNLACGIYLMYGHDRNKNLCTICNVTNNTLISVTLDAQDIMPGHAQTRKPCVFL